MDPNERLGGNEVGISAIQSHPFFSSIDFSTIWTIEPPPIETGITQPTKEVKGELVLDISDGESERGQDVWANGVRDEDATPIATAFPTIIKPAAEPVTKW